MSPFSANSTHHVVTSVTFGLTTFGKEMQPAGGGVHSNQPGLSTRNRLNISMFFRISSLLPLRMLWFLAMAISPSSSEGPAVQMERYSLSSVHWARRPWSFVANQPKRRPARPCAFERTPKETPLGDVSHAAGFAFAHSRPRYTSSLKMLTWYCSQRETICSCSVEDGYQPVGLCGAFITRKFVGRLFRASLREAMSKDHFPLLSERETWHTSAPRALAQAQRDW
mmetsp:Transcript_80082/g.235550  ORF Transcript_80082/g.235550 Transcript_80082/m.235550 type:complete len:225 (-) Transcript_80082:376-1050(-)